MSSHHNSNVTAAAAAVSVIDTTLTKVFVGGLAWETTKESIRKHFEQYGEITEAVIISDKHTGRSKGYGFVTFKDADSAKKACEDAGPTINGRRANCNLASLGVRRPKAALPYNLPAPSPPPLPQKGNIVIPRPNSASPANHVPWFYPAARTPPASPFHHQQPVPYYGYTPAYLPYNHNQKLNHGGSYMNGGHYSQVYPAGGQAPLMGANTFVPMVYPMYPNYHQTHGMGGFPAAHHHHHHRHHQHVYPSPSFARSLPALIS